MDASDILPPKLPNKLGFDTVHKTHGLWQGCDYDQLTTEPGNLIYNYEARNKFSDSASRQHAKQKHIPLDFDTHLGGARAQGWGG